MRRATTLLTVLAALLAAAPARAQAPPTIPPGVTAAGTDLGGLTLPEAAQKLYVTFGPVLGRPVDVFARHRRYRLMPTEPKLTFDVNRNARRAYDAGVAAKGAPVDVPLLLTYRRAAVDAFAGRVAAKVAVAPRSATVRITLAHIHRVPSRYGRAVDAKAVAAAVVRVLTDPRRRRAVRPAVKRVRPAVTAPDLARVYGTVITIDRGRFLLRLFKRLHVVKRYRVAVGQPRYPTPTGLFAVHSKQVNPTWSVPNSPWAGELAGTVVQGGTAANPLKARWMGLVDGVGIHGTGEDSSIGHRASHGCIRMHVSDVVDLYRRVPLGTPVLIGD